MRFFFASRRFKVLLCIILSLIAVSVICVLVGGRLSPGSDIFGTIAAPFRAAGQKISTTVSDFVSAFKRGDDAMLQNAELESEINSLREQLADYETAKSENEFYKNYLEIKDNNPDFKFEAANLISRDNRDPYKGFVINKGTVNDVQKNDPVITDAGLVGFITETGLTTSKVATILSPDVIMGALDNRTNDSGVVSGSLDLVQKGYTKFYNLSRSCNIAVGDYVVTSGEGIFPKGLLVGTIQTIDSDEYNTSIFAAVKPFVDIENIREVMIITDFKGQGGLQVSEGK